MLRTFTLTFFCLFAVVGTSAFVLGADYSNEELSRKGELVKGQTPVHGYGVDGEDTFFYSGDIAELNRFLEAYGKLAIERRRIVIHSGTRTVRSALDKQDRELQIDWAFYRNANNPGHLDRIPTRIGELRLTPTRVDVWLGSRIKLEGLQVPPGIEVVSGGEIEQFVERRQKQAAKVVAPDEALRLGRKDFVTVEFDVATAGWSFAPRPALQPRGPVVLQMGEKLKNGGGFYVMLWGDALGDKNENERCKDFQDKRVRAVGRVQMANSSSASSDYYMTIDSAEDILVVK